MIIIYSTKSGSYNPSELMEAYYQDKLFSEDKFSLLVTLNELSCHYKEDDLFFHKIFE